MAIMENAEDTPEFIDNEAVYYAVSELAAWVFDTFAQANNEQGGNLGIEEFAAYLPNALGAAYIAGCMETNTTNPKGLTIPGKTGAIYNFYFN